MQLTLGRLLQPTLERLLLRRRPAILLANDSPTMTARFRHVLDPLLPDKGKPLGSFDVEPHGRRWIETPLGVTAPPSSGRLP